MPGLQSGHSPPPQEGSYGDDAVALLEGITQPLTNLATAPKAKSDSDDGCTGTIEQLITIMASKFAPDAPEQLYLTLMGKF